MGGSGTSFQKLSQIKIVLTICGERIMHIPYSCYSFILF